MSESSDYGVFMAYLNGSLHRYRAPDRFSCLPKTGGHGGLRADAKYGKESAKTMVKQEINSFLLLRSQPE